MASSSSRLISTFSFRSWDHDVFLSFRGEDTRKTFVDHLYMALTQEGINPYKDDETLPRGESIGPSLLEAIRESRIAIIIFSENYADSCWCLDELAYIMECMDTRGQIVMPVFYNVDPSEVRKQTGKYGEVFANKHELENNHKVDSWRKALAIAGNLSGWVPKDIANGHEAKCIKEIVRSISRKLSSLFSNNDDKDLIGMETRLEDLESMLKIGFDRVRFVGLLGIGGSGKTTLASFACKKFSPDFEAHCILENIRQESSKDGLKTLQEKLLSLILKTDVKLDSEEQGRREIKRRFHNKNVLIVLDDVDDLEQLEELAGSHDWFGKGSRIIITTRDEHVLTRYSDAIYCVSLLSEGEAIKLFHKHAYREVKPVEDYESLSLDVVSYAGGLPLALKVLGSSLYDKDKNEWMSFLAKLRDIPDPKIIDKLKISYDALESYQKEIFLDIACVLRRWPLDQGKMVLDACNFHTDVGVKALVQKSLINVSNGIFDMHDLIEEMAHYIVMGEHPKHPERFSRVWRVKDVTDICSIDTKMENDETEVFVLSPRPPLDFNIASLPWILEELDRQTSLPSLVTSPYLPDVVANMKKLRWIYWEGYPKSSLPKNFQPINLGCLMLIMGRQKELWQGYKGNVDEDRFMSVTLPGGPQVTNEFPYRGRIFTLQLPQNWINDFSGFLVCADNLQNYTYMICFHTMSMSNDSQPDHWDEFDKNPESYDYALVGYIPFGSLKDSPWWNSAYTEITFDISGIVNPKVALVPTKIKGDLRVRENGEKEFSDEEVESQNTFTITGESKVFGKIKWCHGRYWYRLCTNKNASD